MLTRNNDIDRRIKAGKEYSDLLPGLGTALPPQLAAQRSSASVVSAAAARPSPAWWEAPVYNPHLAQLGYLGFCLIYVLSTLLPAIVLAFGLGVYLNLVPALALQVLACLVALDYVVPVEDGFKPNLKRAQARPSTLPALRRYGSARAGALALHLRGTVT